MGTNSGFLHVVETNQAKVTLHTCRVMQLEIPDNDTDRGHKVVFRKNACRVFYNTPCLASSLSGLFATHVVIHLSTFRCERKCKPSCSPHDVKCSTNNTLMCSLRR